MLILLAASHLTTPAVTVPPDGVILFLFAIEQAKLGTFATSQCWVRRLTVLHLVDPVQKAADDGRQAAIFPKVNDHGHLGDGAAPLIHQAGPSGPLPAARKNDATEPALTVPTETADLLCEPDHVGGNTGMDDLANGGKVNTHPKGTCGDHHHAGTGSPLLHRLPFLVRIAGVGVVFRA